MSSLMLCLGMVSPYNFSIPSKWDISFLLIIKPANGIVKSILVLETVQQLRTLAAPVEDLVSVPNPQKVAHNHL